MAQLPVRYLVSDMDGVIYRGKSLIPGARDFIEKLHQKGIRFLFLTNNSEQTPLDLKRKLESMGLTGVEEENFITSAIVTASFLESQKKGGNVYVVGGGGLISEIYKAGFSVSEQNCDYVVVGKTTTYNYEMLRKAVNLISKGAKFIATNPDVVDPTEAGIEPACGSLLAPIETATGQKPYVVGKPNPLMMTIALKKLGAHPEETVMVGDRMDTDIVAGMEAGMRTCLVLSGVSDRATIDRFPYRPDYVFNHVGEIDLEKL